MPQSSSMRTPIHLHIGRSCWNISDSPLYSRRGRIDALMRWLPGLVSSLYSCRLTRPHYITIRLPLKVIPPEHNHTQSKPQTSYIKETVNSPGVYFLGPQKRFWYIEKLKSGRFALRSDGTFTLMEGKQHFGDEQTDRIARRTPKKFKYSCLFPVTSKTIILPLKYLNKVKILATVVVITLFVLSLPPPSGVGCHEQKCQSKKERKHTPLLHITIMRKTHLVGHDLMSSDYTHD